MVHISLLYIFTFFWCSFLLVWYHCSFWFCSISVMSYLSILHISFLESTTAVILHRETLFFCRVTYDAHCCGWRARRPQSMGFYLLDIFIRRLLVRMRAGLFGAFLINYNFFARKLCSLGSFRTLCVHSRWSVLLRLTCVFVCFHFIFIVSAHLYISALFRLYINFRRWLCTPFLLYFFDKSYFSNSGRIFLRTGGL